MTEYITKQQAIDLVKSMEVLIGCTGVSVLTKAFERMGSVEGLVLPLFKEYGLRDEGKSACEPKHGVWYRTPKE